MRVLICPDSFKESLSAREVADILEDEFLKLDNDIEVLKSPLADGGEGTSDILLSTGKWDKVLCKVHDPLRREVSAAVLKDNNTNTCFIESANVVGLTLVERPYRNPLNTTSYGLGEVIVKVLESGCKDIIISLGGSAVSDGGMGMLRALGYKFYDEDGNLLEGCGRDLNGISSIDASEVDIRLNDINITVVCDVENPLYGAKGAAFVFAPQKGASETDVKILDEGLKNLAKRFSEQFPELTGEEYEKGVGAAGGLGYALMGVLKGKFLSGAEFLIEIKDLAEKISKSDLIITGEGKADRQSLMGKVLSGLLKYSCQYDVPIVSVSGNIEDKSLLLKAGLLDIFAIADPSLSLQENLRPEVTERNLRGTVPLIIEKYCNHD